MKKVGSVYVATILCCGQKVFAPCSFIGRSFEIQIEFFVDSEVSFQNVCYNGLQVPHVCEGPGT